ncbi:GFA family protein [Reyranella sp. CPCC 100927]|uniref:GFA family protein n=1 Tax=Reyranella sp. CPCC 100927 TaxID=2599616 RepID=UPI0011B6565C|nr:GFA family protein [Reyranella sp. CPCC 100927]TWT10522.1 GFA family protein [Reyranella sp. CPCC 100927]
MSDWKLPWDGGCRCGQVRLRVSAPPMITSACHCTGCQRMTASAFTLTVTVPSVGFIVTAGEPVIGGLQQGFAHHYFCPRCKSWMFTRAEGYDQFVNVRASMLDDHHWFVPFIEVWTKEKLPWATTPAEISFDTQPAIEDYARLMEDFARRGVRPT